MRWRVEVIGHEFDLEDLEEAVRGLGGRSFKDGDKTFVYTEAFDQMETAAEVNRAAEALLATVNATLRSSDPSAQPVTYGPIVNPQEVRTHVLSMVGAVDARDRIRVVVMTDQDTATLEARLRQAGCTRRPHGEGVWTIARWPERACATADICDFCIGA